MPDSGNGSTGWDGEDSTSELDRKDLKREYMNKKDFLDLIRAYDAVLKLEDACEMLTGTNYLTLGKCRNLNLIYEIIYRNSSERYYLPENPDADERGDAFHEIIESRTMTAEEKCEALFSGK